MLRGEVAVAGRDGRRAAVGPGRAGLPRRPVVPSAEEAARIATSAGSPSLGIARAKATGDAGRAVDVGEAGEPAVVEGVRGEWRVDPAQLGEPFAGRTALLSPFDRLVHDRKRAEELFEFEYMLEMYKPAAKRRWGYFALPILHGDRLVGKLDATADRKARVLRVHAVHEDVPFTRAIEKGVDAEIEELAAWLGLDRSGMTDYASSQLDEIDEISDGRWPWRPVRHHFGITSFGVNAWTGREAGDRIINEHDEADDATRSSTSSSRGRARFELDGERRGRARRHVRLRRARREADGVRRGAGDDDRRGRRQPGAGVRAERLGDLGAARPAVRGRRVRGGGRPRARAGRGHPSTRSCSTTSPAARASPAASADAIEHLRRAIERSERVPRAAPRTTPTSIRSATSRAFKELVGG